MAAPSGPLNLLRPLLLMSYSLYYLPITVLDLIKTLNFKVFLSPDDFKDHWFARFWAFLGPGAGQIAEPHVMPLLRNSAHGVCLDIGPGSGLWLWLFAKAHNNDITKIYGVEPNPGMHKALRQNAIDAGLDGIYEVIGCGAEELNTKGGIQKGSIDTIMTVQCLCSIPTPEKIIKELYPLLKPGGTWLVYEHVRTPFQRDFVGYWQKFINIFWPHMFGGCNICRPTVDWLEQAGEWESNDVRLVGEGKYDTVPHVVGTLTKKR